MKKKEFLAEMLKSDEKVLITKERELAEELMKLRFRKASGQLNQSHQLRRVRRELARVKTVQNARAKKA